MELNIEKIHIACHT